MASRGTVYDARFAELARQGTYLHGEADVVDRLLGGPPGTIVDAGCGTGRVAIELARRGYRTVGFDVDPEMLAAAQSKAPHLPWFVADLATADLVHLAARSTAAGDPTVDAPAAHDPAGGYPRPADGRTGLADLVVAAGNVMVFLEPGTLGAVVAHLAACLRPDGLLVAGFSLTMVRPIGSTLGHAGQVLTLDLAVYDEACAEAGLELLRRSAGWNDEPYDGGPYAVSVHQLRAPDPYAPAGMPG